MRFPVEIFRYCTSLVTRSSEWEKKRDLERKRQIRKEMKRIKGRGKKRLMTLLLTPCICIPDHVPILPTNEEGPLQKREMDRKMVMEMGCDKRIDMKTEREREMEMACLQVGSGSGSGADSEFNCGEEGKGEKEVARLTEMVRVRETDKKRLKEEREISREQKRLIEKSRKEESDLEWTRGILRNLVANKESLSKRLSELSWMQGRSLHWRLIEIETNVLSLRKKEMDSLRKMERYRESFWELERERLMELDMQTKVARMTEMVRSTKMEKEWLNEKEREIPMEQKRLYEKWKEGKTDLELTRETLKALETIKGSLSCMEGESLRKKLMEIETNVLSSRKKEKNILREMERYEESFRELERLKERLMERTREIDKDLLKAADSYLQPPFIPPSDKSYLEERFIRVNVEQDIHSLFRVFSHQIIGDQCYFDLIRHAISTQLRENRLEYENDVLKKYTIDCDEVATNRCGDYYTIYCDEVATNRRGDKLCIMAACDLFRVSFVELIGAPDAMMTEVVPAKKLRDEKHVISRKVIYSSNSNAGIHSLVLNSDQDWDDLNADDLNVRWKKIDSLKQHSNDPNVILDIYRSLLEDQPKMVVPEDDNLRHSLRLRSFGFQRKTMIGDGNCMFRSLSDQIFKSQEHHFLMRSVIVAKLKEHPSRYLNLRSVRSLKSETYDDYRYRMARDMEWGDTACIQAACDAFGVKAIQLYSFSELVFLELYPDGPCKKVIYGCTNTNHMDAMCPLADLPKEESVNDKSILKKV